MSATVIWAHTFEFTSRILHADGGFIHKHSHVCINTVLNALTHEVIVPGTLPRHHEEAQEPVRQQHLHSLIMGWQVAFRVVALVCVLPTPLVAAGGQFVRGEGAGSWREADEHK